MLTLLDRQSQMTTGKSNSPHCKYIPGAFEASMQLHAQFLVGESQVSPTVIHNPETVQKGKFCPSIVRANLNKSEKVGDKYCRSIKVPKTELELAREY